MMATAVTVGVATQLPQAVAQVLDQSFEEPCRAYLPAFLFHLIKPSKFQPRTPVRLFLSHPGRDVIGDLVLQMKPHLGIDLPFGSRSPK
jgi:hypothetical protein